MTPGEQALLVAILFAGFITAVLWAAQMIAEEASRWTGDEDDG